MTLAVVLLVMLAGGMFWYWQALPKQAPSKKNTREEDGKRKTPAKKSTPAQAPGSSSTATDPAQKYRSVSIQCRDNACAAARELDGQRYLARTAPSLPLPKCDQAPCHCSYMHHTDRRTDNDDRRSVHSLQTELYTRTAEPERRTRRGRRKGDNS
jgi:hypothetical protein